MSLLSKIRGTIELLFQLGLSGPQLKNNAGVIEARNAADSAFALTRGLDPVGNDDLITLRYGNLHYTNARVFRPIDYSAGNTYDPTGALDSTSSFAAMMTAVNAFNDRCIVSMPIGVFKVATGTLVFTSTAPQGIIGFDRGPCVLVPTTATGDMIKFAAGSDGCSVQNLTIFQTGSPSTVGAGIHTNGCNDLLISNVAFNNLFNDILVDGGSIKVNITHTVHTQGNGSATSVGILVTNGAAGDTYIGPDVVMSNTGATRRRASVEIVQSGHFEINQCNLTGSAQGILIDPGAGQIVSFGFINETLCDSCFVNGMTISAPTATSTVKSIRSVNSWYSGTVAGTGGPGVVTSGVAGGIIDGIEHCADRFLNNQTHGYAHGFGTGFQWVACDMRGNSAAGSNASDGLNIAAGVSSWLVLGGRYGGTDTTEAAGNQRWGINVLAGASNSYSIAPGDCFGNVTGPVSNNGSGSLQLASQFIGEAVPPIPIVTAQAISAAAATLVTGSVMAVPKNSLRIGDEWELEIAGDVATAVANTNTWILRYGATGTAADAAVLSSAGIAGGAAAATADRRTIRFTIRTLGAAATLFGEMIVNTNGVGLSPANANAHALTAATFDSTADRFFSLSLTFAAATTTYNVRRVHWKKLRRA